MGQECSTCCSCHDKEIRETTSQAPDNEPEDLRWPLAPRSPAQAKAAKAKAHGVAHLDVVGEEDLRPYSFNLQLHSAHLTHSVAGLGWMDPYAVICADGQEVGRTKPDKWAHKEPKWESTFSWSSYGVPDSIRVSVWDRNRFHEDKLAGSVTIPCSVDMGHLERKEFTITKKNTRRGYVVLTMSAAMGEVADYADPSSPKSQGSLGAELDHMVTWSRSRSRDDTTRLRLYEDNNRHATDSGEESGSDPVPQNQALLDSAGKLAPALLGSWKCTATRGLDEFLKATGIGIFQRKIAKAAKWPSWEFLPGDNVVVFINHSAIGDLREEFPLGKEYNWIDGQGNAMTCLAEYKETANGGVLLTSRSGKIGSYQEERKVTDNVLEFTLTHGTGVSWGRTFQRQS